MKSNQNKSDENEKISNRPMSNVNLEKIARQGSLFGLPTEGNGSDQQIDLQPVTELVEERNILLSDSNL